MENLIAAGAFDRIDDNQARLFINVDRLTRFGIALTEERNSAQTSLFGGPANGAGTAVVTPAAAGRQQRRRNPADARRGGLAAAGTAEA